MGDGGTNDDASPPMEAAAAHSEAKWTFAAERAAGAWDRPKDEPAGESERATTSGGGEIDDGSASLRDAERPRSDRSRFRSNDEPSPRFCEIAA